MITVKATYQFLSFFFCLVMCGVAFDAFSWDIDWDPWILGILGTHDVTSRSGQDRDRIKSKINTTIDEQRYVFVEWLYRIRRQYPAVRCFQPDFIFVIFNPMMPSKYIRTDDDIQVAVNEWCDYFVTATVKYGHISKWNTSLVTNMNKLFYDKSDFNDDISKWDVSSVTNMENMLSDTLFNGDISGWNVSSVTNMKSMFSFSQFDGDISGWNVSSVTNMMYMFHETPFDGYISGWNVSSVTNMYGMFWKTPFNGDISGWDVSSVTDMSWMFYHASSFDGDISGWVVSSVTNMRYMFSDCPIPENHKPRRR